MASVRSNNIVVVMVAAAAAAILVLSTVSGNYTSLCPDDDTALVYPYWSTCFKPAVYYGAEVYELRGATVYVAGSLAPEWDESNSTYYVRLADEGATYQLMHISKDYREYVSQSQDVLVVNAESGRYLSWREEGDEYFLVEEESYGNGTFKFVAADVDLPCPLLFTARCQAYSILDFDSTSSVGLSAYEEDGATYFKLGTDVVPFLLARSSTSSRVQLASPA